MGCRDIFDTDHDHEHFIDLLADKAYMQDAAEIFNAPMKDPLYDSCKSSLLYTFKACPDVVQRAKSPDRIMQLRIYNSYTIERNAKKLTNIISKPSKNSKL